ncbi:zf-TFIIB domain-containing protein [Planctomycetota bacterium]
MKCPVCDTELTEREFGEAKSISYCSGCAGLWFGAESLSAFARHFNYSAGRLPSVYQGLPATEGQPTERWCPACQHEPMDHSPFHHFFIDRCPKCKGVWLDRGEVVNIIIEHADEAEDEEPSIRDELLSGQHSHILQYLGMEHRPGIRQTDIRWFVEKLLGED